jgi:hypothetical protein
VREYLVETFGFDDSQLKTLGMGKQTDGKPDAGWGTVQIVIYPPGTAIPPNKQTESIASPAAISKQSVQASTGATSKPQ